MHAQVNSEAVGEIAWEVSVDSTHAVNVLKLSEEGAQVALTCGDITQPDG